MFVTILVILMFSGATLGYGNREPTPMEGGQPKVVTPWGTYLGSVAQTGRQNRTYYTFTKIPYAMVPDGDMRFRPPFRFGSHSETYNATDAAPECLQWDHLRGRGVVGKEDCLYLNVYTNRVPQPPHYYNTQPTMLFLHAGTWLAGAGASDLFQPDYFIESDITVVTMNHRLGPLGFLSTEDQEAPGNYGLLDQIAALEWVRDNVRFFGGMNNSVTAVGSGAGGSSAHLLTMSPLTRGASTRPDEFVLLERAISQSGTAYSPHTITKHAKSQALILGINLGCPTGDTSALLRCLRDVNAVTMMEKVPTLFAFDEEPLPFTPVIDTWQGDDAVLPDEPYHLIKRNEFLQIPWITGNNADDGSFRVQDLLKDPSLVRQLNSNWDKIGPILLHLQHSCKDPVAIAKEIRHYYMGKQKFGDNSAKEFVAMMTDRFFTHPTTQALNNHCYQLYKNEIQCYRYLLHFSGRKSFLDLQQPTEQEKATAAFGVPLSNPRFKNMRDSRGWGVSFLDELLYLFPSNKLDLMLTQELFGNPDEVAKVSTHMILMWSNFMKGGDPTPTMNGWPEDMSPWGAWWDPYYPGYEYYLLIDPEMYTQEDPYRPTEMEFWNSLPLYENRDHNVIRDEL